MISQEQKLQIEQYLISKKLPLDILLEVKDHMISQIEDYMQEYKVDFQTALPTIERSWKENFIPVKYWLFYGSEKIPKIAKSIMKQKFHVMLFNSLLLGILFFVLSFWMIALSKNLQSFKIYFVSSHAIFLLAAILLYISNLKLKSYFRKDFKYKGQVNFTLYQKNFMLLIICFFGMSQIILNGGEHLYRFFNREESSSIITLLLLSAYRLFLYTFAIFGIFNFIEHKKTVKKLQINLK